MQFVSKDNLAYYHEKVNKKYTPKDAFNELKLTVTNLEQTAENLSEWNNSWGNFTPESENMYPNAFNTYYVVNGNQRSFAVVPRLADLEDNALSTSPIGLYVKDLSGEVTTLKEKTTALETSNNNWGNFSPSVHNGHPLACKTYYIESDKNSGERTFAVEVVVSSNSDNALINTPIGLYIKDLTPRVETIETGLNNVQATCTDIASTVNYMNASQNIYVNAETGDDYSNTGLSVSSPFQTIKKALLHAQYCNKAIFNLSPGEYTIPAELYMFSNIYRRFQGTTPKDTIIKTSGIVSDSSRLFFENLTLTAEPESNNVLKAQYRGSASFKNCVINTSHYFCAYATSFSDISVVDTTLNGAHGYALSAIDGSNMRVNNCTDNTGKGIRVGATSVAHICDTSENPIKYTINNYGMVYLNGQQVAPTPTSETAILSMGGNI